MGALLIHLILAFLKIHGSEGYQCISNLSSTPARNCVYFPNACGRNADCVRISETFLCGCVNNIGYLNSEAIRWEDVDKCQFICSDISCISSSASYWCECSSNPCNDIEECDKDPELCGEGGICQNLIGSYRCQCSDGYTNYGNNGTKCVELKCDQHETQPEKTLPGFDKLSDLVKENCLMLGNSSLSGPTGTTLKGDVLLNVFINATDLVQLSLQKNNSFRGSDDVTSFLQIIENSIRLIAPQLTEGMTRIETNNTEAEILVNRNRTQPKGPVSLTNENARLDTTWETVATDEDNYPGFAFVVLLSFKNADILSGNSRSQQLISNAVTVSSTKPNATNLRQPVNLTFRHLQFSNVDPECVYWSDGLGAWSRQGCASVMSNSTHTVCSCNHLSTFSLLKSLQQEKKNGQLSATMAVVLLVTLPCVVLTLVTTLLCRFVGRKRHEGRRN
ncbi:hypothetical protein DPEC_G00027390 [Dallia pectoralis]|uniref:Uncharacterized protein n=1 Tax=Dallia pectoralis TaxID=75939 RepID=A0ACC2HIP1_DALPE|nr:hypothetical protein DPEC_G00027390 [Dallia pectoralis]